MLHFYTWQTFGRRFRATLYEIVVLLPATADGFRVARAIVANAFDRPCDVFLIALNVPSLPSIIQRAPARQVSFLHP